MRLRRSLGGRRSAASAVGLPFWKPNDPDEMAMLARLVETGSVLPGSTASLRLDDVAEAFGRFGAQQHTGKIVISITPDEPG